MIDLNRWQPLFSLDHHSVRVDRVWRSLSAELREQGSLKKKRTATRLVVAMGVAAAAAILLFFPWPSASPRSLATDSGEPIPQAIFTSKRTVHKFSDGSSLDMSANTALGLLENSGEAVRFFLKKGRARFDIAPGGPRLWQVVCGEVSVVVTGTLFSVERDESHVSVSVERGEVYVHGAGVKYGAERLAAGQSIRVVLKEQRASSQKPAKPTVRQTTERPAPTSDEKMPEVKKRKWREHAKTGNFNQAYAELGSSGVARLANQTKDVGELFQLADVARLSGHASDAVGPLSAIVEKSADRSKAGIAAYTLGRLYLDQLSKPKKAAESFEKALALGIPGALQEAATANRIKALWLLNDDRVSALANEYLERYPKGRYRGQVVEWTKGGHTNR